MTLTAPIKFNGKLGDHKEPPLVIILMGTFNGERFLRDQLDSIQNQTYKNWILIVSDDGSTDSTIKILEEYQRNWPEGSLSIRKGPKKGFCQNFLSLACDEKIKADYYAFSDQDDVWAEEKISVALENIKKNEVCKVPYLYCGRTMYVDVHLKPFAMSGLYKLPKEFNNALIHSMAGGNTMVFNQATKELLQIIGPKNVASHDWWVYQVVSGVEGYVFYDETPLVLYRQHSNALVGQNHTFLSKFDRMIKIFQGRFKDLNDLNINALCGTRDLLSENSREILENFMRMRNSTLLQRSIMAHNTKLYRQTQWQTIVFKIAVILKLV
jgi:glycosyltransferase involved in cell wall biosynthesis